ncbi:hypothetical protein AB835_00585 [Candidatus Endobugula sertula]|uniref:Uncharacterized protein n=1 Tax=Candidatus Endobugula sertula TaxID=62101 RepID=A0A1D2QTY4_9GAMM|nr:hypothetical protein AB835_00585 [Candidatus Endobugula sertula]
MIDVLQCPKCNNSYRSFTQCPECLIDLEQPTIKQNIAGDYNQAVIVNGNNTGAINLNDNSTEPDQTTYIQRKSIKPLHVKSWQVGTFSTLSIVGSFASIASIPLTLFISSPLSQTSTYILIFSIIFVTSVMLFLAWKQLKRDKYIKFNILPFMIEQDAQGNLYRTKLSGTCGLCNHSIRVVSYGTHTRAECTHYPHDHWWKFQASVLSDVGDDYNNIHGKSAIKR